MLAEVLQSQFHDPVTSRTDIINCIQAYKHPVPTVGSSFFIHLSELCPVACEHCMYSSTLSKKSIKDALGKSDIETAITLINDSRSAKLNITGGGEPFLKFRNILKLVETVDVPVAGYSLTESMTGNVVSPDFREMDAGDIFFRTQPLAETNTAPILEEIV